MLISFCSTGGGGMKIFTLYLIGYGNQVPDTFFERLEDGSPANGWLVLDIRIRRRSWAWSYSGPQVEFIFKKRGHDYIWVHELGNTGTKHEIHLVNAAAGLMALERKIRHSSRPVVLLCAERLSSKCHRSLVAEKLSRRLQAAGDQLEIRFL